MKQIDPHKFSKKEQLNILALGTGPSVLYNMDKIQKYIQEVNPVIVSVNGYIHGIRALKGKNHKIKLPDKTVKKLNMKRIKNLIPDIHFSFLKFKERTSPITSIKGKKRKHNLFKWFIEDHKEFILKHKVLLMYPGKSSYKIGTKFGYPSWDCHAFNFYPIACRNRKDRNNFPLDVKKMFKKGEICFRAEHAGEYILSWIFSHNPQTFAICGFLDFPLHDIHNMQRGWFWVDENKNMPPKMSRNQSVIISYIKKKYGKRFVDLNINPWR